MARVVTAIILVLLSVSTIYAFGENITVYEAQAEILRHKNNTHVEVGVKILLKNEGPAAKIFATVKALDSRGYELARANIDDGIQSMTDDSVSTRIVMNKMDYLRVDKWKISTLRAYPL